MAIDNAFLVFSANRKQPNRREIVAVRPLTPSLVENRSLKTKLCSQLYWFLDAVFVERHILQHTTNTFNSPKNTILMFRQTRQTSTYFHANLKNFMDCVPKLLSHDVDGVVDFQPVMHKHMSLSLYRVCTVYHNRLFFHQLKSSTIESVAAPDSIRNHAALSQVINRSALQVGAKVTDGAIGRLLCQLVNILCLSAFLGYFAIKYSHARSR
jgi:hypothetical protein